jgi:hypothetical protein
MDWIYILSHSINRIVIGFRLILSTDLTQIAKCRQTNQEKNGKSNLYCYCLGACINRAITTKSGLSTKL